ncbi:fasciclin domain-containing protein [Phormidesmis sp. 146-12]
MLDLPNLLETAKSAGKFKTLVAAVEKTGFAPLLESDEFFTVLAPADEAFEKLPEGTLESLDLHTLKQIVGYHILFGDVRSDDLVQIEEAETMEGSIVAIEHDDNGVTVNDTKVLQTDILSHNGTIHVIDGVLMPAIMSRK